jgi:SAF domain
MLIVGFAAVGAWLYTAAGAKTAVVVLVRDVPAGHVITRSDVSTVDVAGAVTAIAGGRLDSVVGQAAVVHLLPNMLLQRSMVTSASGLSSTQAQVGVAVRSGQIPADGLSPGDMVEVAALPAANATVQVTPQVLVERAEVFAVRDDPATPGGTLLTLVVPTAQAVPVAAASVAGQIALIRVGAS